jgi:hypothetical protein
LAPTTTEGLGGATAIEVRVGGAMVTVVAPLIDPEEAVIVAVPCVIACAIPVEVTGATDGAEDDQVTKSLIFASTPPGHLPIAKNRSAPPNARTGFVGSTRIESKPESVPIPDKPAVCGLVLTPSEMASVPLRIARAVGVKVTEIVQLTPAPNVLGDNGQVDVCAKSPEVEMPEIVSGTAWLFFRVTLFPALVVLITWLAKVRAAGDKVTGTVPIPLSCAVCGEFVALSSTISVPVLAPRAVGLKVTEIVQLSFGANAFGANGQFVDWAKSPEAKIPAMVRGTV